MPDAGGQSRSRVWLGIVAGVVCAAIFSLLIVIGLIEPLELAAFDLRMRRVPPVPVSAPPGNIAIVTLDQGSIEHVFKYQGARPPWPRQFYGLMIEFLARAGARAIVFDIFFSEPEIDRLDVTAEESEGMLTVATAQASNVVHAAVLMHDGLPVEPDEFEALRRQCGSLSFDIQREIPTYKAAGLPSAALIDASMAVGSASIPTDNDNVCRRAYPLKRLQDVVVPAVALTTYMSLAGIRSGRMQSDALIVGDRRIALNPDASAYLRWYRYEEGNEHHSPFPLFSAADVLTSRIQQMSDMKPLLDPDQFRDKIVLIGSTAPGLMDIKATPLDNAVPGVQFQATLLANLLCDDFIARWSVSRVHLLLWIGCLIVGLTARVWRQHTGGLFVFLGLSLVWLVIGYVRLVQDDIFIPVVAPQLGMMATFFCVTVVNHVTERRQTRLVRGIFEHYLDRSVVQSLIRHPERVRLGGETRECSVLFTDVASFTSISESMQPEQLVRFMNVYLEAMTEIIISEGGFVDKFIGDEIVCIFGAPNPVEDHAARVCRATVRMAERVAELQIQFRELGCSGEVFARTGISSGPVVVGNMGSESRMNYTAMGDVMNLGARIEGVNKVYGTRVLVSEPTVRGADVAFFFREVDAVRVKGKAQGARVFELLGRREDVSTERIEQVKQFESALEQYREGAWGEARGVFVSLADAGDPVAQTFVERCTALMATPPDSWDGVYTMTTK